MTGNDPWAARLPAIRLAVLRDDLALATTAASCLQPLADLVDLAEEISGRGDKAQADRILGQVLCYLRAVRPDWAADGDERLLALYIEAAACLARNADGFAVSDLDNAIGCLRQLRAALPAGDADLIEVNVRLAGALLARVATRADASQELADARQLLADTLSGLAPDDPRRPQVRASLALYTGLAYVAFGGTDADRLAGLDYAGQCLADPGEGADTGHFVVAWLTLNRQLTAGQRTAVYERADNSVDWRDGQAATAALAKLGALSIAADDAATALTHLRQVSPAPASGMITGMLPILWLLALAELLRDQSPTAAATRAGDFERFRDVVERARAQSGGPGTDEGDMLEVLAPLGALLAQQTDGEQPLEQFSGALRDVVDRLPEGHPARSAGIGLFSQGIRKQADKATSAPDTGAEVERIMGALGAGAGTAGQPAPDVARAAASVGMHLFGLGSEHRSVMNNEQLGARFREAAAGLGPDDPLRPVADFTYWTSVCVQGTLRQQPQVVDSGIAELKRCAAAIPAEHPYHTAALSGVAIALMDRHGLGGEIRHLGEAREYLERAFASADPDGPFAEGGTLYGGLLYARAHLALMWCNYDPKPSRIAAAVADLDRAQSMTDGNETIRLSIASELDMALALQETMLALPTDRMSLGPEARRAFDRLLETAGTLDPDQPEYSFVLPQAAQGLAMRALVDKDPKLLDQAVALLGDACVTPGLAMRERSRMLLLHGFALQTRYVHGKRDPRDLSNAIGRLEEARRVVDQEEGSPYAAETLQALAAAYRLRGDAARGDVDRAVGYGLDGLREQVGDVLLQSSDESALYMARRGTSDAAEMTRWFLARGRDAAAVSALELGRGMVLHAATSGASLAEALRAAGQGDLAGEWTTATASGQAEPDLRSRAMLAIERSPAEARLLSAPPVGEIATALTESGADALVYLVPRDNDGLGRGLALIVDRHKGVRGLTLTRLPADDDEPLRGLLQARQAAERSGNPADVRHWEERLSWLCGWAWETVVSRLLSVTTDDRRGGPRRIVLVPCGQLGLVPWHAARASDGGYACRDVVLSYASSARQFIDAVKRRPRRWDESPTLVSDADPSLALTAGCVRYLFARYYQAASVFGFARSMHGALPDTVPGGLTATAADMLAALPGGGSASSSLLHFGCHGRTQVPVLRSYLSLGDGHTLRVQDILRQARPSGGLDQADAVGLAVLASCLSDVADADYDEALTLATAFLSAGVGGVLAARWMVAENVTALFMAMFHRYLSAGGLDPPQALRAAQLWMLDPAREIPVDLPAELHDEAEFAREPDGPDLTHPAAWGAFAYQGR